MEPMIKEYFLSFIRTLLGPLAVWLAATGYVSNDAAVSLTIAVAGVVVSLVWSFANKYLWKKTTEGALVHPSTKSEAVLKDVIANSGSTS